MVSRSEPSIRGVAQGIEGKGIDGSSVNQQPIVVNHRMQDARIAIDPATAERRGPEWMTRSHALLRSGRTR
jgi:hypothetical protein